MAAARVALNEPTLHDRSVRQQHAAVTDQRMHAAERVLPVGLGEVDLTVTERLDDHLARVLSGLDVEIGGVNQACGVDAAQAGCLLGVHTYGSTRMCASVCGSTGQRRRGRNQWKRTRWPGRSCATRSMSRSATTPMTGYPPVTG